MKNVIIELLPSLKRMQDPKMPGPPYAAIPITMPRSQSVAYWLVAGNVKTVQGIQVSDMICTCFYKEWAEKLAQGLNAISLK